MTASKIRSVIAYLQCGDGYVGVRPPSRLVDAPAPFRGDTNLSVVADRAGAAKLTGASLQEDATCVEFEPVGRVRKPMSFCPAWKFTRGNYDIWFAHGSIIGAWPLSKETSPSRIQQQDDIRKWRRVPVEGGGFHLLFDLRPDRFICLRDGWFCLGPAEDAAVFSIELVVTVVAA